MAEPYKATLNRGRVGWSVVFRHPAAADRITGVPPLRIRRGLDTRDEAEARELVTQVDSLLANPAYWSAGAAAAAAAGTFDPRVVRIFFEPMESAAVDAWADRDALLPLPEASSDEYRRLLLLGVVGAGKTTLLRQIIGTHPTLERFPATSKSRTTVADTEVILRPGRFAAVVTFAGRDEVRDAVEECVSAAVLASGSGASHREVLRRLLQHRDLRFRFNYVLGRGPALSEDDDQDEDIAGEVPDAEIDEMLHSSSELIGRVLTASTDLAAKSREQFASEFPVESDEDAEVREQLFEEGIDRILRTFEDYHGVVDELLEDIERRFDLIRQGTIVRGSDRWPRTWQWDSEARAEFIAQVKIFTSNVAASFGQLLTPLVNGVRVAGPFVPGWAEGSQPRMVLFDGEGLGHTPDSATAVSLKVVERFDAVDAIVLVDRAGQPMQAAAGAALNAIVSSGHVQKLLIAFTHFDEMDAPNLESTEDKREHVVLAAESVIGSLEPQIGVESSRSLRQRLRAGAFFLGNLDGDLYDMAGNRESRRTIRELKKFADAVANIGVPAYTGGARPTYDLMRLVLVVEKATNRYHDQWAARLGRPSTQVAVTKKHWASIKALTRRLGVWGHEEYSDLRPVSDLLKELQTEISRWVGSPDRWEGEPLSEEEKSEVYNRVRNEVLHRLAPLVRDRVSKLQKEKWLEAYLQAGRGSTYVRAGIVAEVLKVAAPIPDVIPAPGQNQFLNDVVRSVEEALAAVGARRAPGAAL